MSNLKSGDLCLIVGARKHLENIGKVVRLSHYLMAGDVTPGGVRCDSDDVWVCYGEGLLVTKFSRSTMTEYRTGSPYTLTQSNHLMKLKGDFQPEQQKAKEQAA